MRQYTFHELWDAGDGENNFDKFQTLLDAGWIPTRETAGNPDPNGNVICCYLVILTKGEDQPIPYAEAI